MNSMWGQPFDAAAALPPGVGLAIQIRRSKTITIVAGAKRVRGRLRPASNPSLAPYPAAFSTPAGERRTGGGERAGSARVAWVISRTSADAPQCKREFRVSRPDH